jgi:hypothetical protein
LSASHGLASHGAANPSNSGALRVLGPMIENQRSQRRGPAILRTCLALAAALELAPARRKNAAPAGARGPPPKPPPPPGMPGEARAHRSAFQPGAAGDNRARVGAGAGRDTWRWAGVRGGGFPPRRVGVGGSCFRSLWSKRPTAETARSPTWSPARISATLRSSGSVSSRSSSTSSASSTLTCTSRPVQWRRRFSTARR